MDHESKVRKIIKSLSKEFVYGGHLLSTAGAGIILSVMLISELPFNILPLIILYLISQIIYSYNHYKEAKADVLTNPERAAHILNNSKAVLKAIFLYALLLGIILLTTNLQTTMLVLLIILGGVLYTDYFKKLTKGYLAGFKNIYTALFWASSVFIVPFFYSTEVGAVYIYVFLFVFLRWIVNTAFFDIKDIGADKKDGIRTFAVLIGKKKLVLVLHLVNIISLVPIVLGVNAGILMLNTLSLGFTAIYGFMYLIYSLKLNDEKLRNLSYVVVDAEYFIWPILILFGNYYI